MSDETTTSSLPLRRITRSARIVSSSHLTTRPRIGRLASSTQALANSLGRPSTVRRSISEAAPVRYPSWLLPTMAGRADELDQWRDRDLIAIRRARSKNRVVRQVPPRGLPMASHARGRGRLGEQVAPSSIARRLQPVRRAPTPNDAHANASQTSAVRPATPRPPRARRLALPPGKSGDREGPAGPGNSVGPASRHAPRGSLSFGRHASLPMVATARRATADVAEPRSFSAPMPRNASSETRRARTEQRRDESRVTRRRADAPRRDATSTARFDRTETVEQSLRRARPEWTTFASTSASDDPTTSDATDRTSAVASTQPSNTRPTRTAPSMDVPVRRRRTADSRRPTDAVRRADRSARTFAPGWRRVAGVSDLTAPNSMTTGSTLLDHDESLRRSSARRSTLAERVAQLADPSNTPRNTPGALVRRSPVAGSMFALAAAMASNHTAPSTPSSTTTPSRGRTQPRSSAKPTSSTRPATPSSIAPLWRRASQNVDVEAAATARRSLRPVTATAPAVRPGDVARRRETSSNSIAQTPQSRRQSTTRDARRSPSVDRLLDSATTIRRSPLVVVPGGNASSPFIGSLARAVAHRQRSTETGSVSASPASSTARSSTSRTREATSSNFSSSPTGSSGARTGPGADAAREFAERFARRTGEPLPAAAESNAIRSETSNGATGSSTRAADGSIGDLVSRSVAARAMTTPSTATNAASEVRRSASSERASSGSTASSRTTTSSTPRIAYRAATAPRPAAIRRSVIDDLPVAPIVLPPNRDSSRVDSASDTKGVTSGVPSTNRANGSPASPRSRQSNRPNQPQRGNRSASRSTSVRRSSDTTSSASIRRSNGSGSADDAISADALARMIEHGFEPDLNRTITRRVAGTSSSPVRRSPSTTNGSSTSSAIVRRSRTGLASVAPGPIAILGTVSSGADSLESSSGGVTTSQLLDLIDWINRVVDERLRLELERRGMTGGRW